MSAAARARVAKHFAFEQMVNEMNGIYRNNFGK